MKLVRDCFDAFGRGDAAFIVAQVSGDVDWCHPGNSEVPYGGAYKGPEGVARFFNRIGENVEVSSWQPVHVLAVGNEVVATGAWTGKARRRVASSAATGRWCSASAAARSPRSACSRTLPSWRPRFATPMLLIAHDSSLDRGRLARSWLIS
ncbi:MAG: nuclear transport factor 2 family protein [Reyranella sp.]|uniref:nuclear transport factor 2 family protein n=1 Tax=Reyranella sp. TaxID=1929291 RepID=UPI003D0A0FF1